MNRTNSTLLYIGLSVSDGGGAHNHVKYRHFIYGTCKGIVAGAVCPANAYIFDTAGIYLRLFHLVNRSAFAVHIE